MPKMYIIAFDVMQTAKKDTKINADSSYVILYK